MKATTFTILAVLLISSGASAEMWPQQLQQTPAQMQIQARLKSQNTAQMTPANKQKASAFAQAIVRQLKTRPLVCRENLTRSTQSSDNFLPFIPDADVVKADTRNHRVTLSIPVDSKISSTKPGNLLYKIVATTNGNQVSKMVVRGDRFNPSGSTVHHCQ